MPINFTFTARDFIASSGFAMSPSYFVLRDRPWEKFGRQDMDGYFKDGYKIFQRRLREFNKLKRPLTLKEEYELEFMLSSLAHAKKVLYEGVVKMPEYEPAHNLVSSKK